MRRTRPLNMALFLLASNLVPPSVVYKTPYHEQPDPPLHHPRCEAPAIGCHLRISSRVFDGFYRHSLPKPITYLPSDSDSMLSNGAPHDRGCPTWILSDADVALKLQEAFTTYPYDAETLKRQVVSVGHGTNFLVSSTCLSRVDERRTAQWFPRLGWAIRVDIVEFR